MVDICAATNPVRRPPWRVILTGSSADLAEWTKAYSQGPVRVVHDGDRYYLESDELNRIPEIGTALSASGQILKTLNQLARLLRANASIVEGNRIVGTDESGNWSRRARIHGVFTVKVVPPTDLTPEQPERWIDVAQRDAHVRCALEDFGETDADFGCLRRTVETLLLDVGQGDVARGVRVVVSNGWATETACRRFRETVTLGDGCNPGAHSPLRPEAPARNPLSLGKAQEFVRQLLAQWIESKAQGVVPE